MDPAIQALRFIRSEVRALQVVSLIMPPPWDGVVCGYMATILAAVNGVPQVSDSPGNDTGTHSHPEEG